MTQHAHDTGDFAASFQIEGRAVRGRVVRLGSASVSPILARHDYPAHLAGLLGEALTLAALVGVSLKFDGRILVQAESDDGVVRLLVGEYSTHGGLRGYARYDSEAWANLDRINKGKAPHMPQLFGRTGRLGLILLQDNPNIQPYQGIVPLTKGTLSQCAEDYFAMSEQVPSRIRLAVEETPGGEFVAGGMMIQRIAGDETRGDTEEDWREAEALFATLTPQELADPALPAPELLYRLFHEQGVSIEPGVPVTDHCTCNEERLVSTLKQMPDESLRDLVEPDGSLSIDCQFCARHYVIPIARVTGPVS